MNQYARSSIKFFLNYLKILHEAIRSNDAKAKEPKLFCKMLNYKQICLMHYFDLNLDVIAKKIAILIKLI
ncbi:hypothetical protein BpHYR1_006286 [Brachionus plicatilis]|uniref:Uncharacterized protein n=1 Tax=Brachionus plicatilis TaxID=10195 RepID=A0A3M7RAJ3_BRAPC|nr:hypothetical protein BpHYR1_006286 [Brachionus plicatilis]